MGDCPEHSQRPGHPRAVWGAQGIHSESDQFRTIEVEKFLLPTEEVGHVDCEASSSDRLHGHVANVVFSEEFQTPQCNLGHNRVTGVQTIDHDPKHAQVGRRSQQGGQPVPDE